MKQVKILPSERFPMGNIVRLARYEQKRAKLRRNPQAQFPITIYR